MRERWHNSSTKKTVENLTVERGLRLNNFDRTTRKHVPPKACHIPAPSKKYIFGGGKGVCGGRGGGGEVKNDQAKIGTKTNRVCECVCLCSKLPQ
jgi:hypothetical protein